MLMDRCACVFNDVLIWEEKLLPRLVSSLSKVKLFLFFYLYPYTICYLSYA